MSVEEHCRDLLSLQDWQQQHEKKEGSTRSRSGGRIPSRWEDVLTLCRKMTRTILAASGPRSAEREYSYGPYPKEWLALRTPIPPPRRYPRRHSAQGRGRRRPQLATGERGCVPEPSRHEVRGGCEGTSWWFRSTRTVAPLLSRRLLRRRRQRPGALPRRRKKKLKGYRVPCVCLKLWSIREIVSKIHLTLTSARAAKDLATRRVCLLCVFASSGNINNYTGSCNIRPLASHRILCTTKSSESERPVEPEATIRPWCSSSPFDS